jgi:hypothetical protein
MNETTTTTAARVKNLLFFGCRVQFLLPVLVVKRVAQNARGMISKVFFKVNLIRAVVCRETTTDEYVSLVRGWTVHLKFIQVLDLI